MKWQKKSEFVLLVAAFAGIWMAACGSSAKPNQVAVSVFGQYSVMVPTQVQTLTANVTGATDVSATFDCAYTTTPNPTTAVPSPKPSASAPCTAEVGALSNVQNTSTTVSSTATFTAPAVFPDQVKLPNVLVTITATSKSDTKKTGKFTIQFDSGIRITISPATSTIATGASVQFFARDFNGNLIPNDKLKWDVTFETSSRIDSVTCSGGTNDCGKVGPDANGVETYTAPTAIPNASTLTTPPQNAAGIVTIYTYSTVDNARIAQAAITIVQGGDITFSGISPSVAPQGALFQDIFLTATNADSQMGVSLAPPGVTCPNPACVTLALAQIKVVFAVGSNSSSIGARVRLTSAQLATAGHYFVQVNSGNPSVKVLPAGASYPLDIVPARPTVISTSPDNFQEATLGSASGTPVVVDGGFFGEYLVPTATPPLFDGTTNLQNPTVVSSRRITGQLPVPAGSAKAGLFPLSFQYATLPGPFNVPAGGPAYTNLAVIPDYATNNPPLDLATLKSLQRDKNFPATAVYDAAPAPQIAFAALSKPSSIAIDSGVGFAVVTLAGVNTPSSNVNLQNNVQFINLAGGTPVLATATTSGGNVATSVAVDDQLHIAAVVNYGSRSLSVLSVPAGTLLGTVDLSGLIPPPVPANPAFVQPFPYSVGIDPSAHRALVAFASTNVGLAVNLDSSVTPSCILPATPSTSPYCPVGYVTLNSGTSPQIAFEAGARLMYVTPGGAGVLSAVNLSNPAIPPVAVASASRASNVVTVTTAATHHLNPGNPGSVLISGLPAGKNSTNFDGSFAVGNVLDATHFQFAQADKDDTSSCPSSSTCTASSGTPFLTYQVSPSVTGIAINPVTRQAILADFNATNGQITYIETQTQTTTPMSLFQGATGPIFSGSPELGAADTAFQPFSNTALSFNPKLNEVSLLDPSLLQRAAIIKTGQTGSATVCAANCGSTTPPPVNVSINGAIAVDSINNIALVLNSGSDNLTAFKLGAIKSAQIERVTMPSIDDPTKTSSSAVAKIALNGTPKAIGPLKIYGAGFTAPVKVLMDGIDATVNGAVVTPVGNEEVDVTFPVKQVAGNPAYFFAVPGHFAIQVVNGSTVTSNAVDFTVLEEVPIPDCGGTPVVKAAPGGVAIDEVNNLAVVTNTGSGCNKVSVISLAPANIFSQTVKSIATGASPVAVAILPRLTYTGQPAGTSGVAVVTNNSANTVSILDLANLQPLPGVTDVAVGISPSGVAIDQETNLAVIANSGSNTVSTLDLTPLAASPIGKLAPVTVAVSQTPIAVAIDPDRGTNGRGLAVVTGLQLNGASSPSGVLDAVDIGGATPIRVAAASTSFITATPTGIVFDPSVSPAVFYAVSSQANQITSYNPDTTGAQGIKVGINPVSIAYNYQTGTIITVNALSNSISVLDSQTFRTKQTLEIGGNSNFSAAIQTMTNLAVIVDQANNRILLVPLPK
jgi:hypothetical protein